MTGGGGISKPRVPDEDDVVRKHGDAQPIYATAQDIGVSSTTVRTQLLRGEEQVSNYRKGQKVRAVRSIQRSSGAAWPGDEGEVVGETGDGYRVRFADGFVADNVKEHELKES
jgi:hypothetical protein